MQLLLCSPFVVGPVVVVPIVVVVVVVVFVNKHIIPRMSAGCGDI